MQLSFEAPLFLDGGLGTMLQAAGLPAGVAPEAWNLSHPDVLTNIHRQYLDAGAQVITANTFGANRLNFPEAGAVSLAAVIGAAVANSRRAMASGQEALIALDVGPTGKLLQPLGDLAFDEAVELFREVGAIGAACGVDLFFIETMTDLMEMKAAVLGLREAAPEMPLIASVSIESNGRLLTGATPAAAAVMLEGMGVSALGINCGAGPERIKSALPEMLAVTHLPIIAQPNAGLPDICGGVARYRLSPDAFAAEMAELCAMGAGVLGGCCGTTPAHIAALVRHCQHLPLQKRQRLPCPVIASASQVTVFDQPIVIGERINPTGKPTFQRHLREGNWAFLLKEAAAQAQAGAHVLDVNVGLPGIDEREAMLQAVTRIQQTCPLPLQIDSSDPTVLEAALKRYQGKALVNSVTGKEESMAAVFPLMKKYGGIAVALLLDEAGIPETTEGRLAVANRIMARARQYGLGPADLLFDALTLTVSAAPQGASVTLNTLAELHKQGCYTVLGVSNISFGLPQREFVNAAFYTMALQQGLSAAIINPKSTAMMGAYRSVCLLREMDPDSQEYVQFAQNIATQQPQAAVMAPAPAAASAAPEPPQDPLVAAIVQGNKEAAAQLAREALSHSTPLELIQQRVIPALDAVGKGFAAGTLFLPQLLRCAGAAKSALDLLQAEIRKTGEPQPPKATLVLATVQGDIHDIGKNIVKTLMETYHFRVIDLGKDVPPQAVVDAVVAYRAELCGLSALMTTTMPAMEATIRLLQAQAPWCKVLTGGAALTQAYADSIGADAYCIDAMAGVQAAEQLTAH